MKLIFEKLNKKIFRNKPKQEDVVFRTPEYKQLNEKEFVDIIWYSFMFSQGDFKFQFSLLINLFTLLGKQTGLERKSLFIAIQKRMLSNKTELNEPIKLKVTDAGIHQEVNSNLIYDEISMEERKHNLLGAMINALMKGEFDFNYSFMVQGKEKQVNLTLADINFSASELLRLIIINDYKFLVLKEGRQDRQDDNVGSDNLKDRFYSFFASYLYRNEKVKNPYFEKMISVLRNRWNTYKLEMDLETKVMLDEMVVVYNKYHQDDKISL